MSDSPRPPPLLVLAVLLCTASLTACVRAPSESLSPTPPAREGYLEGADGVRLFYRLEGSGPASLVFVQGGPGGDLREAAPDFEALAQGRTVIHYDHRGGGRSSLPEEESLLHIDRLVEDLEAVRRHFGLEQMDLMAYSFGPAVAALYAARHPERVRRLLLVGAISPRRTPYAEQYGRELFARADASGRQRMVELFEAWASTEDPVTLCREYWRIAAPLQVANAQALRHRRSLDCAASPEAVRYGVVKTTSAVMDSLGDWDFRPELARVKAPALVIHGERDAFPLEGAREWAAALPDGRLLVLPGVAHYPQLESPVHFFSAVEAFLAGHWPAGAVAAGHGPPSWGSGSRSPPAHSSGVRGSSSAWPCVSSRSAVRNSSSREAGSSSR